MSTILRLPIIIIALAIVGQAHAYQQYNDGCQTCHGAFTDNFSTKGSVFPGGSKHSMHRSSTYMATACNLCHSSNDNNNPFIGLSDGITGVPGLGCTGCHDAVGLRKHHSANNVTTCAGCHNDAGKTPPAENVNPPYYGTSGTKAKNACNPVAVQYTNENWTTGAPYEGLDNDGNNLYDTADPACAGCVYTLVPTNQPVIASGGAGTITVNTTAGCAWTASTTNSWITLNVPVSGTGTGSVGYIVANNPTTLIRTGAVSIASKTCTIIQAAGCSYSLNPTSRNFTDAGGSGSVTVNASTGCAWTATTNVTWISITSGGSGTGTGTVNYAVAINTSSIARTGTVNAAGLPHTVAQAGVPCTYTINPTNANIAAGGGTVSVSVTSPTGCAWTAAPVDAWLSVAPTSGSSNGTVVVTAQTNTNGTQRTGTATIAGKTFSVTQAGVTCTYTLSPTSTNVSASATSGSFGVTSPTGCAWTATPVDSWIHTTSSGTGGGTVSYTVDANASTSSRSGTINVQGRTFTVNQAGVGCTYDLTSTSTNVPAAGGDGSFGVTAGTGCTWGAASNDSWITITGGASGSGTGTVNFSVASNSSSVTRTGTVTAAGLTFTLTQNGAPCSYSINPTNATVAAGGGTASIAVTAPAGCAWTASSNDGWLTIQSGASGTGSGTVVFAAASNTSTNARSGSLTVAGLAFDVTQTGGSVTNEDNDVRLKVKKKEKVEPKRPLKITVKVPKEKSDDEYPVSATVVGVQNSLEIYRQRMVASNSASHVQRVFHFPTYQPTSIGVIQWSAQVQMDDDKTKTGTATTTVEERK
jgi:hypothetical protein